MTNKKDFALFKALITVGLLFTWILQYRLSIPEKWKAKQLYKNFVRDFYIFRVIKKFVSTAYDKKFNISISCSSFSVYYVNSISHFTWKKASKKTVSFEKQPS